MEILEERKQVIFPNFCLKSLNIIQMNSILKEKKEVHIMNKRSKEKYEVTRTNTVRFEKCTGIQMQKFLNE